MFPMFPKFKFDVTKEKRILSSRKHVALFLPNPAEGVKHAFEIEYCAELLKSDCSQ